MSDFAGFWKADPSRPGVDDTQFADFEEEFRVRLPDSLKELYRTQNGGGFYSESAEYYFLPISNSTDASPLERVCSLDVWGTTGAMFGEDDLDVIRRDFGALCRIFPLVMLEGHNLLALNYNGAAKANEPMVVLLNNEHRFQETVAPSFADWLKEITFSEAKCAIDWNEHKQYPVLFHETAIFAYYDGGSPEKWETILCQTGERGLLFFKRIISEGRISAVERICAAHGMRGMGVYVKDYSRPQLEPFFELDLRSVGAADNQRIRCEATYKGTWKNTQEYCEVVLCEVASNRRERLETLAQMLRKAGIIRGFALLDVPSHVVSLCRFLGRMYRSVKGGKPGRQRQAE